MENNEPPVWLKAAMLTKDLSGYSSEQLCAIFAINLYRVTTAAIWAFDDQERPVREVLRRVLALFEAEPTRIKAEIARYSEELATQVVGYVAGLQAVSLELCRRADSGGLVMWQSVTTGDAGMAALLKALEVDRVIDRRDSDPGDLQQTAVLGAGEQYGREIKEIAALMPTDLELKPIETSLISTELRSERWEFWRAARWRLVQGMLMQLLPLVTPRFKRIRAAGRDAYRGEFERHAAKKRGGTGGRHAKAHGTEEEAVGHVQYVEDDTDEHRTPYFRTLDPVTGAEPLCNTPEDSVAEKRTD
jgi:hypothetical protein